MEGNGQPDVTSMVRAGTVRYWQAWVYLAIFFGASGLTTIYITRNDPGLLERRMRGGPTAEKRPAQRVIMFFTVLGFVALLVVPVLDHRYAWSEVPICVVLVGDACFAKQLAGYSGYQQRVRHRLRPGIW